MLLKGFPEAIIIADKYDTILVFFETKYLRKKMERKKVAAYLGCSFTLWFTHFSSVSPRENVLLASPRCCHSTSHLKNEGTVTKVCTATRTPCKNPACDQLSADGVFGVLSNDGASVTKARFEGIKAGTQIIVFGF